jgi:hypothetical protein
MNDLNLAAIDSDGAIREAADEAVSRSALLRRTAALGGGLVGSAALLGLLAPRASAASLSKRDLSILNYALTLEYLEASFYTEAEQMGALSGELATFARVVGAHERAHVVALKQVLGRRAVKKPHFDFHGTTESRRKFAATSQVLEDTGVAAYKGQAPRIKSDAILEAALAIHAVEARHASWIRDINGAPPAPAAFDAPKSMSQVLAAVASTHFIVAPRRTSARVAPRVTG